MFRIVKIYSVILAIFSVGCGISMKPGAKASAQTSTCTPQVVSPTTPTNKSTDACSVHATQSECVADRGCMAITGARVLKPEECVGPETYVACETRRACPPEIMHAYDTLHRLWRFRTICLPEGWEDGYERVSTIRECGQSSPCPKLSETECVKNILCMPLKAWRIDVYRRCIRSTSEFVTCMDQATCGHNAENCMADPSGQLWRIGSTCFPHDWLHINQSACYSDRLCENEPQPGTLVRPL